LRVAQVCSVTKSGQHSFASEASRDFYCHSSSIIWLPSVRRNRPVAMIDTAHTARRTAGNIDAVNLPATVSLPPLQVPSPAEFRARSVSQLYC